MDCGRSCIKYLLFTFNLLCFKCAGAVVALAAILLNRSGSLSQVTFALDIVPIVLLLLGLVSALISFFGCCGAIRQSTCLLYTYAFFLMVLLLAKGAMAIMALLQMDAMLVDLQRYLERLWDDRQHEVMFWNQLQSTLQCCGLKSAVDWTAPNVPEACCTALGDSSASSTTGGQCSIADAWPEGCETVANEVFGLLAHLLAGLALVAAIIELTGFVFTCVLIGGIRRESRGEEA